MEKSFDINNKNLKSISNIKELAETYLKNQIIDTENSYYQQILSDGIYQENYNEKIFSIHVIAENYAEFLYRARYAFQKAYECKTKKYVLVLHSASMIQVDIKKLKKDVLRFTDTTVRDAFFPQEERQREEAEEISIEVIIDSKMPKSSTTSIEAWLVRVDFKYELCKFYNLEKE
ncbi:hypothetical protein CEF12_13805 [Enterococcus faecalis]|nr:hypothetical protein CEF12_13805 [Enterococcus faecalis]